MWPADIVRLADDYMQRYPTSKVLGSAQVAREGAGDAVQALRRRDVRLLRNAFQPRLTKEAWLAEWRKAARGDKDAAARIGRAYFSGEGEIPRDWNRYEGWMQYAAALGNGIASYELALHYRREGQPQPAAQYEARSKELGYTPPPTLDNVRK
jgi:TPR repeat protein